MVGSSIEIAAANTDNPIIGVAITSAQCVHFLQTDMLVGEYVYGVLLFCLFFEDRQFLLVKLISILQHE